MAHLDFFFLLPQHLESVRDGVDGHRVASCVVLSRKGERERERLIEREREGKRERENSVLRQDARGVCKTAASTRSAANAGLCAAASKTLVSAAHLEGAC